MKLRTILASAAVATVALVSLTGCSPSYAGPTTACHVTDKDRTSTGKGGSDARVYTSNCGTFQVGDDFVHGVYNSADLFGQIQVGHTYNFEAYGYRNGFTSTFPNIEGIHEVAAQ